MDWTLQTYGWRYKIFRGPVYNVIPPRCNGDMLDRLILYIIYALGGTSKEALPKIVFLYTRTIGYRGYPTYFDVNGPHIPDVNKCLERYLEAGLLNIYRDFRGGRYVTVLEPSYNIDVVEDLAMLVEKLGRYSYILSFLNTLDIDDLKYLSTVEYVDGEASIEKAVDIASRLWRDIDVKRFIRLWSQWRRYKMFIEETVDNQMA